MTKADLVDRVTSLGDLTRRDSEVIVDTLFDSVIHALKTGDKVEVRGFGSFRTRQRNSRTGRNPKTGAKVDVAGQARPLLQAQQGASRPRQPRRSPPLHQGRYSGRPAPSSCHVTRVRKGHGYSIRHKGIAGQPRKFAPFPPQLHPMDVQHPSGSPSLHEITFESFLVSHGCASRRQPRRLQLRATACSPGPASHARHDRRSRQFRRPGHRHLRRHHQEPPLGHHAAAGRRQPDPHLRQVRRRASKPARC